MYVFGYGSLVVLPDAVPARLHGYRRVWGVAMDNTVATPGYKVYENPEGARPAVAVAFLDLVPDPDATIDGALIAAPDLALLDARERQYARIDVTDAVEPRQGKTYTYVGREAGRARVADGALDVVIQRAYAEGVERAFAARGPESLAAYRATTEAPPFPVVELARIDL